MQQAPPVHTLFLVSPIKKSPFALLSMLEKKFQTMDILFLLKPDFLDEKRDNKKKRYYCPDCAFLEGVLSYYPKLREQLDIRYIDFPKPRKEIVELVGEEYQGCPNLVLDAANHKHADETKFYRFQDKLYTSDTKLLVSYLREKYGIAEAHF